MAWLDIGKSNSRTFGEFWAGFAYGAVVAAVLTMVLFAFWWAPRFEASLAKVVP